MKKKNGYKLGAFLLPEIEIIYRPNVKLNKRPSIFGLGSAGHYFFETWDRTTIGTQENIRILALSHKYELLGLYELSVGIDSDKLHKYIFLPALRANACAICIGVNHTSGKLTPTRSELSVLNKLIKAGKTLDIDVWDFDIITTQDYYSLRKLGQLSNDLIHNSLKSDLCLEENIRNAVKVDFLKGFVKPLDLRKVTKEIVKEKRTANQKGSSKRIVEKAGCKVSIDSQVMQGSIKVDPLPSNKLEGNTVANLLYNLHTIVKIYRQHPVLVSGTIHRLKIIQVYSYSLTDMDGDGTYYTKVPKILLLGKWLLKAGFNFNNRVVVIPLQRMLIIVPE
jgi:DNA repair protein RadC